MADRTVRLWRCTRCGVEIKGYLLNGQVKATNRPLPPRHGPPAPCLCGSCAGWQTALRGASR